MDAVSLHAVSKMYSDSTAVDAVSLQISGGEFVTLLGPSGCGKTTTLRLIAGLVLPDRGRIEVGGRDVTHVPVHRRNIGMVFQSHALFPHMTIADNVAFGLTMRGVGRAERSDRVRGALELVRLAEYASRVPSQLSGGQQQRVALARALVFNPHVLLLDEPFGALDRKLREVMQVELRELTRKIGMTSIFVTHDQEEALILSDRVAVMNAGKIEQIGRPDEVFEQPTTHFVADFMGFGNLMQGVVTGASDGGIAVQVENLQVNVPPASGLTSGSHARIAIRAERIRLEPLSVAGNSNAAGTIEAVTYQGVVCIYQVRLDRLAGLKLIVREYTDIDGGLRFQAGARVEASWPTNAVRVLRN